MSTPQKPDGTTSLADDASDSLEFEPPGADHQVLRPITASDPNRQPLEKLPRDTYADPETIRLAFACIEIMVKYFSNQGPLLPREIRGFDQLLSSDPEAAIDALADYKQLDGPWGELTSILFGLRPPQRKEVIHEVRQVLGRMFVTIALFDRHSEGG